MNKRTTSLLIALIFSITNVFSFINNSLDIPPTASKQSCDTSLNYEDTSSQQQNLIVLEEAQVNDIPFNTKEIVKQKLNEEQIVEIVLEEEEYIDDIPFNTAEIVKQYCSVRSPEFKKAQKHCCKKYCKSDTVNCIINY